MSSKVETGRIRDLGTFPLVQDTLGFVLPGSGSIEDHRCGTYTTWWCVQEDALKILKHECGYRDCPDCYQGWARRQGRIMRGRILDASASYGMRAHHISISFPPDDYNPDRIGGEFFRQMRRDMYEILKCAGAVGGAVVFHPWRQDDHDDYSVQGPHFHCIVVGRWILGADELFDKFSALEGKIVFKRVDSFRPNVLRIYKYLMEHCGIRNKTHALTWFGWMAYNKMKKGIRERYARKDPQPKTCPDCGGELEYWDEVYKVKSLCEPHKGF